MKNIKNNLEYICILTASLLVVGLIFIYTMYLNKFIKIPECFLYEKFGIYCIGCGSTRAVYSLLKGKILQSIYYNPFILYLVVVDFWYLITEEISKIFKCKNKFCIKNINFYVYVGLLILIMNWIIKMIMLFNGNVM